MVKIFVILAVLSMSNLMMAATSDYKKLAYIDQTLLIGLGASYSKLESYTGVGNYYVISQTNPRFELTYLSKVQEDFRYYINFYYTHEQFKPENPNLKITGSIDADRFGLEYKPLWFSENKVLSYGLSLQIKQANVYGQVPTPSLSFGTIKTRYSYQTGLAFKWYGQTVDRLPMSIDLDLSYVNHFSHQSDYGYGEGFLYKFAFDFDFGRRSYFSNFNLKFFYEHETLNTDLKPFTAKDLGLSVAKAISF